MRSFAGYSSSVAEDLQRKLRAPMMADPCHDTGSGSQNADVPFGVQSRVLGNVLYLMTSLLSKPNEVDAVSNKLKIATL